MDALDKLTPEGFAAQIESVVQRVADTGQRLRVEREQEEAGPRQEEASAVFSKYTDMRKKEVATTRTRLSELAAAIETQTHRLSSRLGNIDLLKFTTVVPGDLYTLTFTDAVSVTAILMRVERSIYAEIGYRSGLATFRKSRFTLDYAVGYAETQSPKFLEDFLDFPNPEHWTYWTTAVPSDLFKIPFPYEALQQE